MWSAMQNICKGNVIYAADWTIFPSHMDRKHTILIQIAPELKKLCQGKQNNEDWI